MDTFPVAPELMQAFPLGALSLLVTVASTVAAQHGVDRARRICRELASNDELWAFIGGHVDRRIDNVDDVSRVAERETPRPLESSTLPEQADPPDTTALHPAENQAVEHAVPATRESSPSVEIASVEVAEVPHAPAPTRRPKPKKRRRNKGNGVVR